MKTSPSDYLLVVGEREALAWILRERRMAFPSTSRREVTELRVGDSLFLTTTRGCFHNPTRDVTCVIGSGEVLTEVVTPEDPLVIAGRAFTGECSLSLELLARYRDGVEVPPLVRSLDAFAGTAWGMRMRRPLVALSRRDATLLDRLLQEIALDPKETQPTYLTRIRPVNPGRSRR